jgi:hypothetical protein
MHVSLLMEVTICGHSVARWCDVKPDMGRKGGREPRFQIVVPYSTNWQRNSEGSIAILPDGRWLLAWTTFYGSSMIIQQSTHAGLAS